MLQIYKWSGTVIKAIFDLRLIYGLLGTILYIHFCIPKHRCNQKSHGSYMAKIQIIWWGMIILQSLWNQFQKLKIWWLLGSTCHIFISCLNIITFWICIKLKTLFIDKFSWLKHKYNNVNKPKQHPLHTRKIHHCIVCYYMSTMVWK